MAIADEGLWPLATGPDRTGWAAEAIERYLHMARIMMTRGRPILAGGSRSRWDRNSSWAPGSAAPVRGSARACWGADP